MRTANAPEPRPLKGQPTQFFAQTMFERGNGSLQWRSKTRMGKSRAAQTNGVPVKLRILHERNWTMAVTQRAFYIKR